MQSGTWNAGFEHAKHILYVMVQFDGSLLRGDLENASKLLLTAFRQSCSYVPMPPSAKRNMCASCGEPLSDGLLKLRQDILSIIRETTTPLSPQRKGELAIELDKLSLKVHFMLKKSNLINKSYQMMDPGNTASQAV